LSDTIDTSLNKGTKMTNTTPITTLKLTSTESVDGDTTYYRYEIDTTVECDGSSIYTNTNGRKVKIKQITIVDIDFDNDGHVSRELIVEHDSDWKIYTDRGFETAISELVGFPVSFTEQGMQSDNYASME
jgi:hypothetical protein